MERADPFEAIESKESSDQSESELLDEGLTAPARPRPSG
jgi:hypothetical protein